MLCSFPCCSPMLVSPRRHLNFRGREAHAESARSLYASFLPIALPESIEERKDSIATKRARSERHTKSAGRLPDTQSTVIRHAPEIIIARQ